MSRQLLAVPAAALEPGVITDPELRVLLLLGDYANKDGWCWPDLETLAERLKVEKPSVSKRLTRLKQAGFLDVHYEVRDGRRRCVFRVLFDRPVSTASAITDAEYEAGRVSTTEPQRPAGVAGETGSRVSTKETQNAPSVSPVETRGSLEFPSRPSPVSNQHHSFLETFTTNSTTPAPLADASGAAEVIGTWNRLADMAGLPKARLTPKRTRLIATRLREAGWREDFVAACAALEASPFHRGANDRGWVATLDFVLRAGKATELAERASVAPVATGPAAPDAGALEVGGQRLTAGAFTQLCADGGLNASMQSRETLEARVQSLHAAGRVADPRLFLALVLHVQPWVLAEISFGKTREERLRERLASWRPPQAGAA